ncbi:acyltransferase [Lachnoclostridium pacaense]|uniref:acyltransferase family protein n=1 Tax=Enterocloster hominis (ex Hitch et al. 2024) TaxID=1917870 RepID=UPI001D118F59|nr:acyltransferase [Lachnoclostridium pacaense]MCC2878085.1 acyltransferase [Lachnoclostridium pacaense]
MNKKKKKYTYISIMQIISALLILLLHSNPDNVSSVVMSKGWYRIFYFILYQIRVDHIALVVFMGISGMLCTLSSTNLWERKSYLEYVKRRALRLLLPYIVINILLYLPKALLNDYMQADTQLSVKFFLNMITNPRSGVSANLWFLPTLFWLSVMSPILQKIAKYEKLWVRYTFMALFVLIHCLPDVTNTLALNDVKKYLMFYYLGMLINKQIIDFSYTQIRYILLLLGCGLIGFVITLYFHDNLFVDTIYLCFGGIVVFTLSLLLERFFYENKEPYLGDKTMSIYLLSFPVTTAIDIIFGVLGINTIITVICMFLFGLCIPVIIHILFNRFCEKIGRKLPVLAAIIGG